MEPGSEETPEITVPSFKVLWHPDTRGDLGKLSREIRGKIIETATYKLSRAPQFIGQPIKGTKKLLWKIRFSKYRIVYTIAEKTPEVWIVSVGKRDSVYRNEFIQSWIKLAIAIHETEKR